MDTRGFAIEWNAVGGGRLSLGHRPRLRRIRYFPVEGCDRVVTLLSAAEGAEEIGELVQAAGMAWTWIPLPDARPPSGRLERAVRQALRELSERLAAGESIVLHCSAGIHRTGMIAYALLRMCGIDHDAALERIGTMRAHTLAGLTDEHVQWGRNLLGDAPAER